MRLLPSALYFVAAYSAVVPLYPRCVDPIDNENPLDDGPSNDGTAGIGAEFETPGALFRKVGCGEETFSLKGKAVVGHSGTNWMLTGDTRENQDILAGEIIMDGRYIKVGTQDAVNAARAAVEDLRTWNPSNGDQVTVDGGSQACNPWSITSLNGRTGIMGMSWSPQVTAPLPLAALYTLMEENVADPITGRNILDGYNVRYPNGILLVTRDFFLSSPNGIDTNTVSDEVLAFCTLVMSYAKAARHLITGESPKIGVLFMPRTEFNTIFSQMDDKIPGDLFNLFNILACYRLQDGQVVLDGTYCSGSETNPVPNDAFSELTYTSGTESLSIKAWIQGIGSGSPSPDLLTQFDKNIDGSIGYLGSKTEKIYNSARSAPLFEFRDLSDVLTEAIKNEDGTVQTNGIEEFMVEVNSAIMTLHAPFAGKSKRQATGTLLAACPTSVASSTPPLETTGIAKGQAVKTGVELRILPVGDSITVGFEDPSLNGYRLELQQDLSADHVVFAGTEHGGTMCDGYFGAWSGQTIDYIASHVGPSLAQRPNIILLHAGTNDMNANPAISKQGNDPNQAAQRLGNLIDQMVAACPDATILVAQIIPTIQTEPESSAGQEDRTTVYNSLIPGIVASRAQAGSHVLTVDFGDFPTTALNSGGVHLTPAGYALMGDWWYDYIHQIPADWINPPVGADPTRPPCNAADLSANGGPDPNIPPPVFPPSVVQPSSKQDISSAAFTAGDGGPASCNSNPLWSATGQIALGIGHDGDWQYHQNWVSAGSVAEGIHLGSTPVHLADINNDGKADYLWVDPESGRLIAWLNNLPGAWSPAGTDGGVIADGAGAGSTVFFADMNGDGFTDYLVVDGNTGSVTCYWNYGADASAEHGWRFVPGGVIATGVPHANLGTLRFPDINGDGRADYVIVGEGGSLGLWLNTGQPGSQSVLFEAKGGIATGASPNITDVVFGDINGDGRDDYLVWDNNGGLTGFLNQRTEQEGLPFFVQQSGPMADGIGQDPSLLRLADLDADGKDDYVYVDTENGALWVWWNRGTGDTSMAEDGLRFADIDNDGLDDFVWLDPVSGAPTVYINNGPSSDDTLGWSWAPLNGGNPIASGAGPSGQVQFGDIDGDGAADYLVLDPKTGALDVYLNAGWEAGSATPGAVDGWLWKPIGQIASGLGPGANSRIRFADIDGDGKVDYIYLHDNGGTTIYRNQYQPDTPNSDWIALPNADASGIGQRPEEISFHDVNGDGKADYIWTNALDGSASVWMNNYPNQPTWLYEGQIQASVGESGADIQWATLQNTSRASYIAVNPHTNAISAWLNGCSNRGPSPGPAGDRGPCIEISGAIDYDVAADILTVDASEDGTLTCSNNKQTKFAASDETQWSVSCGSGVTIAGNILDGWQYNNTNRGISRWIHIHASKNEPYVCERDKNSGVDVYCSTTDFSNVGVCPTSPLH